MSVELQLTTNIDMPCFGVSNGKISANVNGGAGGYYYSVRRKKNKK